MVLLMWEAITVIADLRSGILATPTALITFTGFFLKSLPGQHYVGLGFISQKSYTTTYIPAPSILFPLKFTVNVIIDNTIMMPHTCRFSSVSFFFTA